MVLVPMQMRPRTIGKITLIKSSFIDEISYDVQTNTVTVTIARQTYSYSGISLRKYIRFLEGRAVCLTNDQSSLKRWHRGKTPSLGAFYNQFIKLGGVKGVRVIRAAGARIAGKRRRLK